MSECTCPLEGCTVSFGSVGSVKAHITRKTDDLHGGLSGPEVVNDSGELTGEVSPDSEPTPDPDGGSVIGDGPEPDPPETTDEPTCPDCGGDRWFDASEPTDGEYQYGCPDCSGEGTWVVWSE